LSKMPLFRKEVVDRATRRLDGAVVISVPVSVSIVSSLLIASVVAAFIFAATATYARKVVLQGWITWSSGLTSVRASGSSSIVALAVHENDWVSKGQTLAWFEDYETGKSVGQVSTSMIVAPVAGQVLISEARIGKAVAAGETLFVIAPNGGKLQARLLVPSRAMGFLEVGQDVKLALEAYPFQRYGTAKARISRISGTSIAANGIEVPIIQQEQSFIVDAELLTTSLSAYGKTVELQNGMRFSADVVFDRRSLIEWLLDPLYAVGRAG
jgi:multidrug efflux pump subunit AcrA (membrane-fusion protein)